MPDHRGPVIADLVAQHDNRAARIRRAARARRPRCWCGCSERAHRPQSRDRRRSCRRCLPSGCPTYVPCSQLGTRVTAAHHVARARSDLAVRMRLDLLWPFALDAPADRHDEMVARIPRQRGPGAALRGGDA